VHRDLTLPEHLPLTSALQFGSLGTRAGCEDVVVIVEPDWTIASADGNTIAVYEFGGSGEPLLLVHATGFGAPMYRAFARELTDTFRVVALDVRGHGNSSAQPGIDLDWDRLADDVIAVANRIGDGPLHAFGHSMGGGVLALAEHLRPGTFRSLFLYEPIAFPSDFPMTGQNFMANTARKRRDKFASREEVLYRYATRPPLNSIRAEFLVDYIDNGFVDNTDGTVSLKCLPENEARIFEEARAMQIERVADVVTPTVVAVGQSHESLDPALLGPFVAKGLANATLLHYDHIGHFGPFEDPFTIAQDVRKHASSN
jgi:pimeloyl-ACP methyl ester carboxylesterase